MKPRVRVYNAETNKVRFVQESAVPHLKAIGFVPQPEPETQEEIKLEKTTKPKPNATTK